VVIFIWVAGFESSWNLWKGVSWKNCCMLWRKSHLSDELLNGICMISLVIFFICYIIFTYHNWR